MLRMLVRWGSHQLHGEIADCSLKQYLAARSFVCRDLRVTTPEEKEASRRNETSGPSDVGQGTSARVTINRRCKLFFEKSRESMRFMIVSLPCCANFYKKTFILVQKRAQSTLCEKCLGRNDPWLKRKLKCIIDMHSATSFRLD